MWAVFSFWTESTHATPTAHRHNRHAPHGKRGTHPLCGCRCKAKVLQPTTEGISVEYICYQMRR
nr:MAG TPA: hypothetical protein [Caudoviricetes sp.]